MGNVLVIDDDKNVCTAISNAVERMGHKTVHALTLKEGLEKACSDSFDVVFLDVQMPDGNGLDILPPIRGTPSSPEVIIITGFADPDGAELAIKNGAWDYIEKPCSVQEMTLPFIRALEYREEKKAAKVPVALKREGIVGSSPKLRACLDLLPQMSNSVANVLITGETGTGKELFARAIHENSPRAGKNFVVVDCAALPDTLVESVLFGHQKGAFTGADKAQDGLVKQADRGTLFLDEVGELPLSIQKSFLRVLQERRFRPVGGEREITSDFRLISATNRDIESMVRQGTFRGDLLFRIQTLTLHVPPLREHLEDIKELILYYMVKWCDRYGIGTKAVPPEFIEAMTSYDWPGNVRELMNALELAMTAAGSKATLYPRNLPTHVRAQMARSSVSRTAAVREKWEGGPDHSKVFPKMQEFRKNAEHQYLRQLISFTKSDIREACRRSGLSRSRLYALMKKHRISARG
jgi:two-component system NtrC family response regulator